MLVNIIHCTLLRLSIGKCKPASLDELLEHVDRYIVQEESEMAFNDHNSQRVRESSVQIGKGQGRRWILSKRYQGSNYQKDKFTPLNISPIHLLN